MTGFELITQNKARYNRLVEAIGGMTGLEKRVAETMTAAWIKGEKWMGGLPDRKASKILMKLEEEGYTYKEIDAEFTRQMDIY